MFDWKKILLEFLERLNHEYIILSIPILSCIFMLAFQRQIVSNWRGLIAFFCTLTKIIYVLGYNCIEAFYCKNSGTVINECLNAFSSAPPWFGNWDSSISIQNGSAIYRFFCLYRSILSHWGRGTHICVNKLTIIGSDNGLSPGRCQAIT